MATGSMDSTIKVWDASSEKVLSVFDGHTHLIPKVIELSNGDLASYSLDRTVNVWDRHTGEILNTLEGFEANIRDIVELDAEKLIILEQDDNAFTIWNHKWEHEDNCKVYSEHEDAINKVIVLGQRFIFTASSDCTIKKWQQKYDESVATYVGHKDPVSDLVMIGPDFKTFASASVDKTIRVWEISTRYELHVLRGHTRPVMRLQYIQDLQRLVSSSADMTLRVWDRTHNFQCLFVLDNQAKTRHFLYLGMHKVTQPMKIEETEQSSRSDVGKVKKTLYFGEKNDMTLSDEEGLSGGGGSESEDDEAESYGVKVLPMATSRKSGDPPTNRALRVSSVADLK